MFKKIFGCLGIGLVVLILLGVLGAIFGSSDDSKTSNPSSQSSQATTPDVKKDGLTYEKFVNIPMGSSYEDVKAAVGKDGELQSQNQIAEFETKLYTWVDGTANMNCTFQNGALVSKAMASLSNLVNTSGENITMKQFEQVNIGMNYEQVKNILGRDGFLLSQSNIMDMESSIYVWMNNGGANMNITFSNGVVDGKTQLGLK